MVSFVEQEVIAIELYDLWRFMTGGYIIEPQGRESKKHGYYLGFSGTSLVIGDNLVNLVH
jgi:hypothetical protein